MIHGGQNDTVADFLRVLRFPLLILIPQAAPYTASGVGTVGPIVAYLPVRLTLTPPHEWQSK
jgi:hypothetical protein